MATSISTTTTAYKRTGGRLIRYDLVTITFTGASTTESYTLTLSVDRFPGLAQARGVTEFVLHRFAGELTADAASITPRISSAAEGMIAQCPTSTAALQDQTSHPCRTTPLPFTAAIGTQLTVVLAPDITGSGTVTIGIGWES